MKSSIKKLMLSAGILSCALGASAQMTYSGYFLDNYTYRFQMNPAFGNDKGFVSFPALGDINIGMHGTLNLSDVVYPLNGKTVLFTNPGISEKEVMGKFKDRNRLGTNFKLDILSVGFKAFGGYNAVSLSTIGNLEASVPKSFLNWQKRVLQTALIALRICSVMLMLTHKLPSIIAETSSRCRVFVSVLH